MCEPFLCVTGEDVWSYAKKLPHLFQQGGVFYNIVKKDMGKLVSTWIFKLIDHLLPPALKLQVTL